MSIESMARFGALLCELTPQENYVRTHTPDYFQTKLEKAESEILKTLGTEFTD